MHSDQDRGGHRPFQVVRTAPAVIAFSVMLGGCATPEVLPYEVQSVPAAAETAPMTGWGDRADDPAYWHNVERPDRSLILATNKAEGLYVYYVDGEEAQVLPVGQLNNVDIRDRIAVASNDEVNAMSWFRIEPNGAEPSVIYLGDTPVGRNEPYGVCLGQVGSRVLAAATYKDGTIEFWQLDATPDESLSASLKRTVKLPSQLEGCVFDDAERRIFIGEEGTGIWSLDLADDDSIPVPVDTIDASNGLRADVEGLALYLEPDGGGFLIASAQSADRFVVYDRRPPHRVRGAFNVTASEDGRVDAVTHTDGLEATSRPLPDYPRGVLIVQDDGNPRKGIDQNFKLVDWREVERVLSLND